MNLSIFGFDLADQTLLEGLSFGLGYGLLAVGFVLLYRNSRVINIAYAEVGAFASAVLLLLVAAYGWNYWIAAAVALLIGAFVGGVIELTVIRRLAKAPKVVVFVATAGVAQVLLLAQTLLPSIPADVRRFVTPFEWRGSIGDAVIRGDHIVALVVAPIVVIVLAWFLNRSIWGIAIRGSADNTDAARLAGIPSPLLSTIVWAVGGVLATITQLMTRPLIGVGAVSGVSLDARLLVIALTAATVARLRSLPIAMVAGVLLGLAQRALLINYPSTRGLFDLLLMVVTVVAILTWPNRVDADEGKDWMFVPSDKPIPGPLTSTWWAKRSGFIGYALMAIAAFLLPFVVTSSSRQFIYTRIVIFAIIAVSVTILTGWAGQLSLGQFAFAGVAAYTAMRMSSEGLAFIPSIIIGVVAATACAVIVGLPALRVQGLLLAVITLAFALFASNDLYERILGDGFGRLDRSGTPLIDLGPQRSYYWFCLLLLGIVVIVATRIRKRGSGRSLVATRSNELNAAALAIWPAREKLTAFGIAGALAGLGGVLLAANAPAAISVTTPDYFPVASIEVISIAVIGGLTSVRGAILGTLWVAGLPAFFPDSAVAPLLASGVGLLVVLMYFPGGLGQIFSTSREAFFKYVVHRRGESDVASPDGLDSAPVKVAPAIVHGDLQAPALSTTDISVSFGGNIAVDRVSITVPRGEVVGLIGSNGAGKSTLLNAIGGYVPSTGSIELHGRRIDNWQPARRSVAGLGRTFQSATLFPELVVREVIQVALERRMRTSWTATLSGWPSGRRHEAALRRKADDVIGVVGLGRYAEHRVGELSTGTRRIVELACLIAHGGSVLCLDEPTAGVAQKETEAFGPLLLDIRRQLDATLIIIEHDMPLIMSISDTVYCMEAGWVIASGNPTDVRNDPKVIASYLGTEERAIDRSDSARA